MGNADAVSTLEALKEKDGITYNYIYGTYFWSTREFDEAKPYTREPATP
jgi:hypothetical protein